ncbi:MAG: hypothetical protein ACJAR8_001681 [Bacteroidia bacterium]|jgi:hypothetical protein
MKVIFIDQTSQFDHHQVFNSSIVDILSLTFKTKEVTCEGIATSHASMKPLISQGLRDEITYNSIVYPRTPKRIFFKFFVYFRKEYIRYHHFKNIFKQNNSENTVIFLSISTFTGLYYYRRFAKRSVSKVLCVLHGDMDYLYKAESFNQKLNAYTHSKILGMGAQVNFKYVLLNKVTKPVFLKDNWLTDNEMIDIFKPISSEYNGMPIASQSPGLILGHIGSMEIRRKQSQLLYPLAQEMSKFSNLKFRTVGLVTAEIIPYKNDYVQEISGNKSENEPFYLSREDYVSELQKLDYVLFFFPSDEYVMRASGAVMDFVGFLKPIIALKHPLFDYFTDTFGDIGYICDTMEEMQEVIADLSKKTPESLARYQCFVDNLAKLRAKSAVSEVAIELREQLTKKGWDLNE